MKSLAIFRGFVPSAALLLAASSSAEDVTLNVASGTQALDAALTANGYASWPSTGARIVKTGEGMLEASADATVRANTTGIWVREGALRVTHVDQFGSPDLRGVDGLFAVARGATLYFTGSSCVMIGPLLHIAGAGSAKLGNTVMPENGAIAIANNIYAFGVAYVLDDDATIMNVYGARHAEIFGKWSAAAWPNPTCINLSEHVLTLGNTASARSGGYGFLLNTDLRIARSGRIVMDHAPLVQRDVSFTAIREAGTTVELVLSNSAPFHVTAPSVTRLFDNIRILPGSEVKGIAASDIVIDLDGVSGAGAIGTGVSLVCISNRIGVAVADVLAGQALSVTGEVVFAVDAKLAVEGDASLLSGTGEHVVLRAAGGISGVPAVEGSAHRCITLGKSRDGKTLTLSYVDPKPAGAIDAAADWGIVAGSDTAAAANTATFNIRLAQAESGSVVYFPAGEYLFSAPLAISGKNVVVCGDGSESILRGSGAANVMTVADSADITITRLTLSNCTGPAVAATRTTRLTVSNLLYSAVGGVIEGEAGAYPLSVENGTQTYVRHNRVTDGATYASPVFLNGGTVAAGSEPLNGLIDMWVDAGETEGFHEALAKTGSASFPAQATCVKTGPGTLVATNDLEGVMRGVRVEEGIMRFSKTADIGIGGYALSVSNGATAVFMPGMYVGNRQVSIAGNGAPGMGGAIVVEGRFGAGNMALRLRGDATIIARHRGNLCELMSGGGSVNASSLSLGGSTLTLRAANGCAGIATQSRFIMNESGSVVVDGTTLTDATADTGNYSFSKAEGVSVSVSLVNGAAFKPKFADWVAMFSDVAGEKGTLIDSGSTSLTVALAFDGFAGLPTLGANITSLAISDRITVDAADFMAGKHLVVDCPIIFAAGTKVVVLDPGGALAMAPVGFSYPFVESTVSLSGSPRKDAAFSDTRSWRVDIPSGGLIMNIAHPLGMFLSVR